MIRLGQAVRAVPGSRLASSASFSVRTGCAQTASRPRKPDLRARVLAMGMLGLCLAAAGCALKTEFVPAEPSAITQRLVFRSLERALAGLDVSRFIGRRVTVALFTQTKDATFAKEFLVARLREQGVLVVSDHADLKLEAFAAALGTDAGQTFLGIPSIQASLLPVATPEIALFKWARHRGRAEIQIYAFDSSTDAFLEKTPRAFGGAKQDDYTVLLFISFTVTDLEEPPEASPR